MPTSVQITLIICATLVTICSIYAIEDVIKGKRRKLEDPREEEDDDYLEE